MDIDEAKMRLKDGETIEVSANVAGDLRAWARRDPYCKKFGLRIRGGLTEPLGSIARIALVESVPHD